MRLIRYGEINQEKPGLVDDQGQIRDLSAHIDDINGDTLSNVNLAKLAALNIEELAIVEGNPRIGPCVGKVGKIICVGLNFSDHAAESGMDVPPEPTIFFKSTTSIIGPNDDVLIPKGGTKTDGEVELAIVIGEEASYVDEDEALDYIAGYALFNDLSERAFQMERSGQWVKGKSCNTFGPLGPWMVTKDTVGDVDNLDMALDLNGGEFQRGNTSTMVFKVPYLVSHISQFMTLQPGDIISTGTPPGVGFGRTPPVYLKAGDTLELSIEKLGTQKQNVLDTL